MDCPRVLGKQRNMRGYYRPAQRPDGQQMTLFFQTLCRLGEEEEEEEDELGRREGEEEKGLSESFGFTGQLFSLSGS